MSITFSITNSPDKISYSECLCVYDDQADPACPWCQGTGMSEDREPAWPWTNMANTNAANVLRAIGVAPQVKLAPMDTGVLEDALEGLLIPPSSPGPDFSELFGESFGDYSDGVLEGELLDDAIKGCLRALNSPSQRAVAVREPVSVPGGYGGVRVVQCGNVAHMERMGPPIHVGGYSDDHVLLRVNELLVIFRKAKEEGEKVVWG